MIFLDDVFVPECDAKIGVFDRGFLMGDGVYATIQVKEGMPLFLPLHIERLTSQCHILGIIPPQIDESTVFELIEKNKAFKGIWKLKIIVTGGNDPEMRLPQKRKWGHLIMTLKPFTVQPFVPLRMGLFPSPILSAHASFKSLAHLNRYYVVEHAKQRGFDDGVSQGENGVLLEASFANLCWFLGRDFYTPDSALPLHFGVTIGKIKELADELGYKTHFVRMPLKDISEEAFVFRVNTMSGMRPIIEIEGKKFKRDLSLEERLILAYEKTLSANQPLRL